ncbi:hypothetical protein K443DRAFT_684333, partial [Laccaria amethystina LaAM-08-1]
SWRNNCLAYKSQIAAPPFSDPTDVVASLVPRSIGPGLEGSRLGQCPTRWFVDPGRCPQGFNPPGASCNIFDDVCRQGFCPPVAIFREFAPFIFAHLVPIIHRPLPPFPW